MNVTQSQPVLSASHPRHSDSPLWIRADELIGERNSGELFDAGQVLEQNPEFWADRSLVIHLAYEEFCRRVDAGESPNLSKFAEHFTPLDLSIFRLIDVHACVNSMLGRGVEPVPEPDWPTPQSHWLGFDLLLELGRGTFSRVYLARETAIGHRLVVVKAAPNGRQEATLLSRCAHPHVVPVFSVAKDPETKLSAVCLPFLGRATLEHVRNSIDQEKPIPNSARTILDAVHQCNAVDPDPVETASPNTGLDPRQTYVEGIVFLGAQVARALAAAHDRGLLHRDIKPTNILVTANGDARLIDFNLACGDRWDGGPLGGTLPYMAQEQINRWMQDSQDNCNSIKVDARADIYGLGATLFHVLGGRLPFPPLPSARSTGEIALNILDAQLQGPPALETLNPDVSPELARLIESCLAWSPDNRPQSAAELAQALESHLSPQSGVRRSSLAKRRILRVAFAACAVLVVATAGFVALRAPPAVREFRAGVAAFQKSDFAAAESRLTGALAADPNLLLARFLRGHARLRNGDLAAARDDFSFLADCTDDGRVTASLAHVASRLKQDTAIPIGLYQKAVEQGFCSAELLNNLGYCHMVRADLDAAEKYLRRAIELAPDSPAALENMARVEFRLAPRLGRAPDPTFVRRALELGPETGPLDLVAACTMAQLASRSASDEERARLLTSTVQFSAATVRLGTPAVALKLVEMQYPALAENPEFSELLAAKPGPPPPPPPSDDRLLLDPLGPAPDLVSVTLKPLAGLTPALVAR